MFAKYRLTLIAVVTVALCWAVVLVEPVLPFISLLMIGYALLADSGRKQA